MDIVKKAVEHQETLSQVCCVIFYCMNLTAWLSVGTLDPISLSC